MSRWMCGKNVYYRTCMLQLRKGLMTQKAVGKLLWRKMEIKGCRQV